MPPSGNLNVVLEKRGPVTLRQTNYVTSGGEASIYRLNNTIVKIFTDPGKMIADRMTDKIGILSGFTHPFVVNPQGVVTDPKGKPLGYYMGFVDGEPFSRVFTTAFRQRSGFDDDDAIQLVHNMREVLLFAHPKDAILGDANELNWLMVKPRQVEPRVVDVDSWQIGQKWPLRVIMPSIRDYHTKGFNEASDWFSWGIVSFQVFTGIHPYKGRHDGYKTSELDRRMRDNVSVFHADVRVNAAVRDFKCIPGRLTEWYRAVFERGERTEPPSPLDRTRVAAAARTLRHTISTTGALVFEKLLDGGTDPIIRVYPSGVVMRASGEMIELSSKRDFKLKLRGSTEIIRVDSGYLAADVGNLFFLLMPSVAPRPLQFGSRANKIVRSGNRLFAVTDQGLSEVKLVEMGSAALLTIGQTWPTLPMATEWFSGFGVQNSLGAKHLVLPFDDDKVDFIRVQELDDVTVVTGRAGPRFVSIVALNKQGEYKKYEFTFDRDHRKYTRWIGDTDTPDLNLAILPNGVCATITQDGELTIFEPARGTVRKIPDRTIATDMQLSTIGDKVVYVKNGDLWWVRVK